VKKVLSDKVHILLITLYTWTPGESVRGAVNENKDK
jgi:hypothetical protein